MSDVGDTIFGFFWGGGVRKEDDKNRSVMENTKKATGAEGEGNPPFLQPQLNRNLKKGKTGKGNR